MPLAVVVAVAVALPGIPAVSADAAGTRRSVSAVATGAADAAGGRRRIAGVGGRGGGRRGIGAVAGRCRRLCRWIAIGPGVPVVPVVPLTVTVAARIAVGVSSHESEQPGRDGSEDTSKSKRVRDSCSRGQTRTAQHARNERAAIRPVRDGRIQVGRAPLPAETTCSSSDPGFCTTPNVRPLKVGATIELKAPVMEPTDPSNTGND